MSWRRSGAIILLVLFASLSFPGQAFAVTGTAVDATAAYRAGIAASRNGDHAEALEYFRNARAAGKRDPALTYNLGVTHYQLGEYSASLAEFEQLIDEPAWRDIAHYNLALIALRQEREAVAAELFRKVATQAEDARLRRLAQRQLEKTAVTGQASPDSSTAFVSLSLGRDDNVVAFPEQLQQDSAAAADGFSELLLYGEHRLAGSRGDGIVLKGYGVTRRYADLDTYDSSAYGAGALREQELASGTFSWGGNVIHAAVDSNTVTTALQLDIAWQRHVGNNRYTLGYRPELHRSGGSYPQLEGSRHRLDFQWQRRLGDWYLRSGYRFETNHRETVQTASGNVFNYSPTRQRLSFSAYWPVRGNWQWTGGVMIGQARYDGENRLQDVDGETVTARRESDTVEFHLRGSYHITGQWRIFGELRNEQVDDTFQLYSWEREIWRCGVEFTY